MQEAQMVEQSTKAKSFTFSPTQNNIPTIQHEYVLVLFPEYREENEVMKFMLLSTFEKRHREIQKVLREYTERANEKAEKSKKTPIGFDWRKSPYWGRPYQRINPDTTYRMETNRETHETSYFEIERHTQSATSFTPQRQIEQKEIGESAAPQSQEGKKNAK